MQYSVAPQCFHSLNTTFVFCEICYMLYICVINNGGQKFYLNAHTSKNPMLANIIVFNNEAISRSHPNSLMITALPVG